MSEGWFTLAGVAVGAVGAMALEWTQRKARRADARRQERLDLVSRLIADADTIWHAQKMLQDAAVAIGAGFPDGEPRRQAAFAELKPARRDARITISRLRILASDLVPTAEALVAAAEAWTFATAAPATAAWDSALEAFEKATAPMVE